MPSLTRDSLRDLINNALRNICRQSGSDAAYLAVVMREMNKLAKARGFSPTQEDWNLTYAQALLPGHSDEELKRCYGARNLVQAFPDLCRIEETQSGDLLRWMHADAERELLARDRAAAKERLREMMEKITAESGKTEISCSALKVRLNAENAPDEKLVLGYPGFRAWLEDCQDIVTFVDLRSGGRVRLLRPGEKASPPLPVPKPVTRRLQPFVTDSTAPGVPNGYIIVESYSIMRSIRELLGHDAGADHMPSWDAVMKFFRMRWPAESWKGLYFVCAPEDKADSLSGFFKYLSGNGYRPIHLFGRGEQVAGGTASMLIPKVEQQIDAVGSRDCHIVVVSNSAGLAGEINKVLAKDRRGKLGVCGLIDSMDPGLLSLRDKGADFFDLERDVHCIRKPLPRFRPIAADQFDPTRYL